MKTNYYAVLFSLFLLVLSGCSGSNSGSADPQVSPAPVIPKEPEIPVTPTPETVGFIKVTSVADEEISVGQKGMVRTSIVSDENHDVLYFQWLDRNEQVVEAFTPASGVMYPNGKNTDFVFEYNVENSGDLEYKLKITNEAKQEMLSVINIKALD